MIAASVILPASAVAADGLTIWVFAGPEDLGVGDTLEIVVEAYMWGQPVHLDTLDGTVGIAGTNLSLQPHGGLGKYHTSYVIANADLSFGLLLISVAGEANGLSADATEYYFTSTGGGGTAGWDLTMRMADFGQMPMGVLPGTTVTVEARSYNNGTLEEGSAMTGLLGISPAMGSYTSSNINGTKVADGVYRFTVQVPATLSVATSYSLGVQAGPLTSRVSETMSFYAQPFPFFVSLSDQTATSAVVDVVIGLDAPVSGASVGVSGSIVLTAPPYVQLVGPFNGTTDARGHARIAVNWTGTGPSTLAVNMTSQGKTAVTAVFLSMTGGGGAWTPDPNFPIGCSVTLQTNPATVDPGTTATLKFRVTDDGTPLADTEVTVFARSWSAMGMEVVGNRTTDATGNFTITYNVAASWDFYQDQLAVDVLCPSADGDDISEALGEPGGSFGTNNIQVSVAATAERGGTLQVTATYNGTKPVAGAYGFAMLVPGNNAQQAVASLGANFGGAVLTAGTGGAFTGTIEVPEHFQEGNYTVIVFLSNYGATSQRSDEFQEGGVESVQVVPPGAGPGPTPGGGGFLPGFEAVALIAAMAGLVLVVNRRRR